MSPPRPAERRFSEYLEDMVAREDRGALAALRRGLGKGAGEAAEMYPYVVRFLPDDNGRSIQNAYYLVAALFAWHQLPWRSEPGDRHSTNLGASFAWLKSGLDSDSIEKRFVAMLNSHRDDLPEHLRHAVGLLKAHEIPVDWAQLLHDLQGWEWEDRSVQRSWAGAYWGAGGGIESGEPDTGAAPSDDKVTRQ